MEKQSTYLKRLKFNPKLLNSFISKYLGNLRLVLLLTLAIVAFGIVSYTSLPRKLNPEIKIPIVLVSTVLPGAGPKDVESLISIPIEDAVRGVGRVKKVTSSSRESVSIIQIEFESGTDPEKAKSDVQGAVDGVNNLPENAQKPKVQKLDFENQPIWVFNLTGTEDRASLIRFARILMQDLEDLASIDKVEITGLDEQEVQIVLKPTAIANYSLNPQLLIGAIKGAKATFPAGNLKTDNSTFSLTIDPAISDVSDIRSLKLSLNGQIVSLGDVALVTERSKPEQVKSFLLSADGKRMPSVSFNVFRVNTVNFDKADHDAKALVNQKLVESLNRYSVFTVQNAAEQIDRQFNELQRDILLTVLLVFVILFIFLGIRQAIVSMLSIPLTFLITFVVMNVTGIALSFIATFSLLLSLGLLVDDTIVVISAMSSYYRSGKFTPLQTGLLVWRDFWIAILTTTITTVWAFLPLLLSTGIIGEFIKPIPIVVSSTLLGSIAVALFITLPFIIFLLNPNMPTRVRILIRVLLLLFLVGGFYLILPKNNLLLFEVLIFLILIFVTFQVREAIASKILKRFIGSEIRPRFSRYLNQGVISFQRIDQAYKRIIFKILSSKSSRRMALVMVGIFSLFSYLLLPLGLVKSEFFPKTDEDFLYVSIELPAGTNLGKSNQEGLKLLGQFKDIPETKFVTLEEGQSFNSGMGVEGGGSNNLLYSIVLKERKNRRVSSIDIAEGLREKLASYNNGKVSVIEISGGPPAGSDLQIKLFGGDLRVLDRYATKIEDYLSKQSGVTNIDKTIKPGTGKLTFVPDKNKLAQNNLSVDQLGFWLRIYASGLKADTIKLDSDSNKTTDITIRLGENTQFVEGLSSINIPTPTGGSVPLMSLGKLQLETNPSLITREDQKRTLSVTASVKKGANIASINNGLEKFAASLDLPPGYGWATGGLNEENQRSVTSIIQAMGLSFLLIVTTMVLQFRSFRRAMIVMMVIPLSISGVFIIFALTHTPLSFPALIGILALFGIVVKNSILVVDKILINQRTGMDFVESIADAAASRLEPIALTSMAAIAGLIPVTLSDPLWRGLGGAIISGLTFSGTVMLVFIPVVYYLIFQPQKRG